MRVVCFSPARASTGATCTVTRKLDNSMLLRSSVACSTPTRRLRVRSSRLAVITTPICNKHMTRATVRHLQTFRTRRTPIILIIICNGHSCRSTLGRLSSALISTNFIPISTNTFIKRRSFDHGSVPVTTKHPSRTSRRTTIEFKHTVGRGLRGISRLSYLGPLRVGNGFPCGIGNPSAPRTPIASRSLYARYRCYVSMYPMSTVSVISSHVFDSPTAYVGYYTYIGRYPRNTHAFSAPCATVLRGGFDIHHRPRLFV